MRHLAGMSIGVSILWLICLYPQAALADQLSAIRESGHLRVAIINGLPGYSFSQPGEGITGSDAEVARLISRDMGVSPEFIFVSNADRIPALLADRADVIISALSITPEREQSIAFSVPYSAISMVVAAPDSYNIGSYLDLRGLRVGAGRNTSDGAMLKKKAPAARILEFENEPALVEGYLQHRFSVISCQEATLLELNSLLPKNRQLEIKFIQTEFQVAIGLRKSEPALRNWINQWVVSNLMNGRLNGIFRRYHGRSLPDSILPRHSPQA